MESWIIKWSCVRVPSLRAFCSSAEPWPKVAQVIVYCSLVLGLSASNDLCICSIDHIIRNVHFQLVDYYLTGILRAPFRLLQINFTCNAIIFSAQQWPASSWGHEWSIKLLLYGLCLWHTTTRTIKEKSNNIWIKSVKNVGFHLHLQIFYSFNDNSDH